MSQDVTPKQLVGGRFRTRNRTIVEVVRGVQGWRQWQFWIPLALVVVQATAAVQKSPLTPSYVATRAAAEAFLSQATVVTDPPADGRQTWRATLDSGRRRHDASIETADGRDPTRRDYRLNVAAYELDKLLELNLVIPTVERVIGGRAASVGWWLDAFAMNELDRRRRRLDPRDPESWARQMHAVRVFDELISNTYRDTSPPLYLNSVWDNLLITKDWTIWLTDHAGAFRIRRALQAPETLTRCPRVVLGKLRALNRDRLQRTLARYLSAEQAEALDARRGLLVRHFDDQITRNGEAAVLYDLASTP